MIYFITSLSVFIVAAAFTVSAIVANGNKLAAILDRIEDVRE